MNHIKTGISAKEIMNKNFPIVDTSLPLIKCAKKMNKEHEACLVIKNGDFYGILENNDILRSFAHGKDKDAKIENIKIKKNFAVVQPNSDVYKTLLLMKQENINFVLVKDNMNFLGIITKKELADIEPLLFEDFNEQIVEF